MSQGPKSEPVKARAADRATHLLRVSILRGEYLPGTALPPERSLSEQLNVSRLTVRAAIARLESEGLVHPVQGSGTVVLDFRQSGGLELLGPLLFVALSGGSVPLSLLRELLELRVALAVETLGLAAERASEADQAALTTQWDALRRCTEAPDEFMRADLAFARLWVEAAKNLPLQLLYNTIERALRAHPEAVVLFVAPDPDATITVYGKLLGLLRDRDPDRLRKLARRLLGLHDGRLLRTLASLTPPPGQVESAESPGRQVLP